MNIREYIEAGHYEKDDKGRSLVPMRGGGMATIYATDHRDGGLVIVGMVKVPGEPMLYVWDEDGYPNPGKPNGMALRPPATKVAMWGLVRSGATKCVAVYDTEAEAARHRSNDHLVVELKGEYHE